MSAAPLKIFYDARTVMPGMTGVGRYSWNLLAALARRPGISIRAMVLGQHLELMKREGGIPNIEWLPSPVSHEAHPAGEWWLWRGVRKMVRPVEIYHGPAFIIPLFGQTFKRVVTIHDLFVFDQPEFYPAKFGMWLRWMTRRACADADRIIVPSRVTAEGLARWKLASAEKVAVIPEAPDATPAALDAIIAAPLAPGLLEGNAPLIISIGTLDPRKDTDTARRACVALWHALGAPASPPAGAGASPLLSPFRWLWLGGPGPRGDNSSPEMIAAAAQAGFFTPGPATSAEVKAALARASVYVTSSRAEGFGIPLVEAMAAGCPVIGSDLPIHREVCGDAAEYFHAGDHAHLAEIVEKMLGDPAREAARREHARQRGAQFGWEKAAAETEKVYRAVTG